MGIKLTYAQLNSESLNQAINMLSQQNGFANFQAAYNVARIVRQFQKELGIAREMYNKWSAEYFVKNEDGSWKQSATPGQYTPWEIVEGKAEEYQQKMKEFLETQIELNSYQVKIEDLGMIRLAPVQINALEPIFSDVEPAAQEPHIV